MLRARLGVALLRHHCEGARIRFGPYYDVDYCRYGFEYRKATRIWTNLQGFEPKVCDKNCGAYANGRHLIRASGGNRAHKGQGGGASRNSRYRIPEPLVRELLGKS